MLNTTKNTLIGLITGKCIALMAPFKASGDAVARSEAILQPSLQPPCPHLQQIRVEGAEDPSIMLQAAANPDQEAGKAASCAAGGRWAPGMGRNWELWLRSAMLQEPELPALCFSTGARSSVALGWPQYQ